MKRMRPICAGALLAALVLAAAPALAHEGDGPHAFEHESAIPNRPVIVLDFSGAPDLFGFAYRAKARCEAFYNPIANYLGSVGYTPPSRLLFVFRERDGVTGHTGTRVEFGAKHFRENPHDHGAAIHEMVHIIQKYPRLDPAWLVDGIADYVRYYITEPVSARPKPEPDGTHYTDGDRVAAAFLYWVTHTHDKGFVPAVNAALREDRYTPSFWRERTGQDLDPLWAAYTASLRAKGE